MADLIPVLAPQAGLLNAAEFQALANIPPETEWFGNLRNENTKRAYQNDLNDFLSFMGIGVAQFRHVKRSHLIAWRKSLEHRQLGAATIRRKLSAISTLFDFLCEANAIDFNPANGVERPNAGANEGKSAALGDHQAALILEAPSADTLKGKRDRAILAVLLFHGLRRSELCRLKIEDIESRRGVLHFCVQGKGEKIRYIPVHPQASRLINDYELELTDYLADDIGEKRKFRAADEPLFLRMRDKSPLGRKKPLTGHAIYKDIVLKYAKQIGIGPRDICVHGLRATAATNALEHKADIARVQEWLGHSNICTTRLYDRRKTKPEDSPTFSVRYE